MVENTIPPTPTTSSSTNVIIPPANPINRSYAEWDSIVFLLGGICLILFGIKHAMEFIKGIFDFVDRKKKRDQELDAPLENRLKQLEEGAKHFKHREDLDREFQTLSARVDHEKANRQTIQEGFDARLRNLAESQQQDQLARTRLEQKVESLAANSEKVEASLEKLQIRIDDRFDKLHAAILSTRGAND